ncbi:MAG: PEP-CTERM sorting domain-containing protein [Planctomycetota bacterium]
MKKILGVMVVLALCASANADVITFGGGGNNIAGGAFETMIANASPMTGSYKFGGNVANYGGLDWFGAKESASTRSLLRFDMAALNGVLDAVTAPVNSVTLRLYQRGTDVTNLSLFMVDDSGANPNSNWEEGTDTGSYSNGWWNRTSWSYCNRGISDSWDGGAGGGTLGTVLATVAATPGVDGAAVDFVFTGTQAALTAMMSAWATDTVTDWGRGAFAPPDTNVTTPNPGMLLLGNGATFYSSENGNGLGPELIVDYVPEPATISLLALGGVAALIRRKK